MFDTLFTAAEARGQTIAWQEEIHRKEVTEIETAIKSAIEQGEFKVEISHHVSSVIKERLSKLGYKVECGQQYNETFTIIKW